MNWLARKPTLSIVALLLASAAVRAADVAGECKPTPAVVVTPGAAVRSGPAESYYLTETLPQDTTVDVYRQQPDGWCAIRPPEDSFSWVYASHTRLLNDGLAEINKDDVAARVGSRLSTQRDAVQVRLRKGEIVHIVGTDERDGATWFKIAPPAGEFRWIHAKDLTIDGAVPVVAAAEPAVAQASHEAPPTSATAGQWTAIAAPPLVSNPPAPSALPTSSAPPSTISAAPPTDIPSNTTDVTPVGPGSASSADTSQQLSDLELRLSRMVAEPMATWNIEPLEQAAEQLLSQADTVADRDAVKSTLAKIDRFAAIQRRSLGTSVPTIDATPAGTVSIVQNPTATATGAVDAATSPYDAVGVLRPVVSRRPGAPQFALVNEQGQVVTFVSATPDVNLQPYLGRRIGIAGSRGYIPEFRRPHVTAGRVTPLNERMLR